MSQISDSISISCTKDGVSFASTGDLGSGRVTLKQNTSVDKEDEQVCSVRVGARVRVCWCVGVCGGGVGVWGCGRILHGTAHRCCLLMHQTYAHVNAHAQCTCTSMHTLKVEGL